jgi:DNA-binding transcriptional ArsR family regulator
MTQGSEAPELDADAEAALRVIANPAQRRVLEVVAGGEISSGALADACGLTRPAASQHLRALKDAALVEVRVDGNRRLYRVRMENLARLREFLDQFWASRLGLLADSLAKPGRSG